MALSVDSITPTSVTRCGLDASLGLGMDRTAVPLSPCVVPPHIEQETHEIRHLHNVTNNITLIYITFHLKTLNDDATHCPAPLP